MTKKTTQQQKKSAVFLSPQEEAFIAQDRIVRGLSKQEWLSEAVRSRMRSIQHQGDNPDNPFRALSPRDVRLVEHLIRLLRHPQMDEIFRVAIEANFALFERSLK